MLLKMPFLAPTDAGAGGGPESKEDIINFFTEDEADSKTIELDKPPKSTDKTGDEDDEDTKEKGDNEKDEDEPEEKDELDELEEELDKDKETDDDELEMLEPVRRKEILAKYPKLFKDFPYLERAYYREQQFTELFPTMKEAKQVISKAETLENFEKQLINGNIETVLSVVSKADKKAFDKVVDSYIPSLLKVDPDAGYHVIGNIIKDTIISMHGAAKKNNDNELMAAAKGLNKFVFGTDEFEPKMSRATTDKEDEKDNSVERREREMQRREFERSRDTLNEKVDGMLRRTVQRNIDPRESMTEWTRNNATRDAMEQVTKLISGDKRFSVILDRLWERAIKNDFKKADIDRIEDAFVSKAKTLLPSVIKKARQEALRGMGKRTREEKEPEEDTNDEPEDTIPRKKTTKTREAAPSNSGRGDTYKEKARQIPAGMSARDYLEMDD